MAENLNEYLKTHRCKGFVPLPHYFVTGDFVTYYFRNERAYSRQVDDLLSVYLSMATKELVGCKIDRVKRILEKASEFGFQPEAGDVPLGLFLFVGSSLARDAEQKRWYDELQRVAKDVTVKRAEFAAAAT